MWHKKYELWDNYSKTCTPNIDAGCYAIEGLTKKKLG